MSTLRSAIRECRAYPVLSLAIGATLSLALASTALTWSAFECLVLRTVPGRDPSRIVTIGFMRPGSETRSGTSLADIPLIRERSTLLDSVGGYQRVVTTATLSARSLEVSLIQATPGFFENFGAAPAAGRWPEKQDRSECGLVISDAVWRAAFDRDETVVGRPLELAGAACTIAAVARDDFNFPDYRNQVWMFRPAPAAHSGVVMRDFMVFGRLKGGSRETDVASELNSLLSGGGFSAPPDYLFYAVSLRDQLVGPVKRIVFLMAIAVAVLVLAACTNIVSLLLARDWGRQRDIAIRLAIGATRRHLFRDGLMYLIVVAAAGSTAGLLITWWSLDAIRQLRPRSAPGLQHIGLTPGLFVLVLLVAFCAAVLVSLLPALRAWQTPRSDLARDGRSIARTSVRSGAGALVCIQVALSVVLAVSGGLFARSLVTVLEIDPGFEPQNLTYFHFSRDRSGTIESDANGLKQLLGSVRGVSGVSAALTTWPPFIGITEMTRLQVETAGWSEKIDIPIQNVSADYFNVMQIPILHGRVFNERMRTTDPCEVVISDTMARKFWPSTSALGRRMDLYNRDGVPIPTVAESARYCSVIGVVADVRERVLTEPTAPRLYFYLAQRASGSAALMVRATSGADVPADRIKALIRESVPEHASGTIRVGEVAGQMRSTVDVPVFQAWIFGLFATTSLIVLSIGVFGSSWFTVVLRMKEIGIRLSLGAQPQQVVRLFVWQGVRPVFGGIGVGLIAAAYLSQYLGSMLVEIVPLDPVVFGLAPIIIAAIGAAAVIYPVLRARRVDPKTLLQTD